MFAKLIREPLLHFLALGALLFAIDAWRADARPAASAEIVVTEARVRALAQNFARTWQRPPTRVELEGLVESHVREEVMVREALALGLDRDDTIVRRRLQQKVEFVSDQAAALAPPTEADLARHLERNAEAFRREPRLTFVQVFLDPRKRGPALEADAARLLEQLAAGRVEPAAAGDALALVQPRHVDVGRSEVEAVFGPDFAQAVAASPVGTWTGPLPSGYGAHLVRVESRAPGAVPALAEVRSQVEREWMHAQRQELLRAYYAGLRAKYTVSVQMPASSKP